MGVSFPWDVDEVSEGKSWVDTAPAVTPPDEEDSAGENVPLPPPMSDGGMKGPAATRVGALSASGMGWLAVPTLVVGTEPVVVRSTNALLPRAVHPERAAAPASIPTNATAL